MRETRRRRKNPRTITKWEMKMLGFDGVRPSEVAQTIDALLSNGWTIERDEIEWVENTQGMLPTEPPARLAWGTVLLRKAKPKTASSEEGDES